MRKLKIFISRKENIALVLAFFINIALLFLIDLMTFKYFKISGNGNPALIAVFIFLPVHLTFLVLLYRFIQYFIKKQRRRTRMFLLFSLVIVLFFSIYKEINFIQSLLKDLGGGPHDLESVIYRFGWLNQYTNTIYFNFYTFSIVTSLVIIICVLINIKKYSRLLRQV